MQLWGEVKSTHMQQSVFRVLAYAGQRGATVKEMVLLGQELDLPGAQEADKAKQSYASAVKSKNMPRMAAQRSEWSGGSGLKGYFVGAA